MTHHRGDEDDEIEKEADRPSGGFLLGLLLGGLIGLGTALLIAPASGEATRQMLRQRAADARDEAREKAEQARAKAKELEDSGRDLLEAQKRRVARTAEAVRQSAVQAWSEPDQNGKAASVSPGAPDLDRPHA